MTTTIAPDLILAGSPLNELARFFELVGAAAVSRTDTRLQMFSPAVDAAWHNLADDPSALAAFSVQHAGTPVGHSPARGAGEITWVPAYEGRFGVPLPEIWFTRSDGTVDTDTLLEYRRTGRVVSDWDCSPVPADPDSSEGGVEAPPAPTHTAPHPQQKPLPGYGE